MQFRGFIYVVREINSGLYKIGSSRDVQKRLNRLAFNVELIHSIRADDVYVAEGLLHKRYRHLLVGGEWFNLSDKELSELGCIKHILSKRTKGTQVGVTDVPQEIVKKIDIQLVRMGYKSRQKYLLDIISVIANSPIDAIEEAIEAGTLRPRKP